MKLLLQICCGPCTIYPLKVLRDCGIEVTGYFYNPNIHPYREFKRRVSTLEECAKIYDFPVIIDNKYGLTEFVRKIAFQEEKRCSICYSMRLENSVALAKNMGFDCFSTTLLYSRYQRHAELRSLCEKLCLDNGVQFFYQDFRQGWQYGIDKSIEQGMYRQPYCGCIYSEQERYDKSLRKK